MTKGEFVRNVVAAIASSALVVGCASASAAGIGRATISAAPRDASPAVRFGDLFVQGQMRRLFLDGKTFVAAVAKQPDAEILKAFHAKARWSDVDLRAFVLAHFEVPAELAAMSEQSGPPQRPLLEHIRMLWDGVARPATISTPGSTALPFGGVHVVPDGRFREIYY